MANTMVSTTLQDEIRLMGRFATAPSCTNIFQTLKYECAWACSDGAAGTELVTTKEDRLSSGAGLVAVNTRLKSIFVSFRGTGDIQDWLVNAFIWQSKADFTDKIPEFLPANRIPRDVKMHAGFELQYVRLRDKLIDATLATARKYSDYKIVFAGHSLGGAVGTLAAVDFFNRFGFGDRISVYTFGSPRVGNQVWAQYVNNLPFSSRIYRIQRRGDPVHYLPPRWTGYQHSGQMYQILDDRSIIRCANEVGSFESPACMSNFFDINPTRHRDYFGDKVFLEINLSSALLPLF